MTQVAKRNVKVALPSPDQSWATGQYLNRSSLKLVKMDKHANRSRRKVWLLCYKFSDSSINDRLCQSCDNRINDDFLSYVVQITGVMGCFL